MKLATAVLASILFSTAILQAGPPDFQPVANWLKPPQDLGSIGPAHGDIAVSANGDVYVSVGGPKEGLQVYDSQGNYLRNVPGAPNDLHGFVIHQEADGEFIYGARVFGGTVLKMQLDGTIVLSIPRTSIPEELIRKNDGKPALYLTAVDVAPDGRIFVVDGYSSDLIHIFDQQGKYLDSFGGKEPPYSFQTLHKIAIDTRFDPPRILCCDRESRRVVQLSLEGEILQEIPDIKRPAAIVVHGDLAAVAEIEGRVSLLDKAGRTVKTLGTNDIPEQTATNQVNPEDWRTGIFTAPHGLDFDEQGNLFVTEFNVHGRVIRYDRDDAPSGSP